MQMDALELDELLRETAEAMRRRKGWSNAFQGPFVVLGADAGRNQARDAAARAALLGLSRDGDEPSAKRRKKETLLRQRMQQAPHALRAEAPSGGGGPPRDVTPEASSDEEEQDVERNDLKVGTAGPQPPASSSAAVAAAFAAHAGPEFRVQGGPGGVDVVSRDTLLLSASASTPAGSLAELRIARLLTVIRSGMPPQRKSALRALCAKADDYGAGRVLPPLLDLLGDKSDQQRIDELDRHVLMKTVGRLVDALSGPDLVPLVPDILAPVEPALMDADKYARIEARQLIGRLAKAAGVGPLVDAFMEDVKDTDDAVRTMTGRAVAAVAQAAGMDPVLPFVRALCGTASSWEARDTGMRALGSTAQLLGRGLVPRMKELVSLCVPLLQEGEVGRVQVSAAHAVAALAEASNCPEGNIADFDAALRPLWNGLTARTGKALVAHLRAVGRLVPLMDATTAPAFIRELFTVLSPHMESSPDEEMRLTALNVFAQVVDHEGLDVAWVRAHALDPLCVAFWGNTRLALLDHKLATAQRISLMDASAVAAVKVGAGDLLGHAAFLSALRDRECRPLRLLAIEAVTKVVELCGTAGLDGRQVQVLVDSLLFASQELLGQADRREAEKESAVVLRGLGTVIQRLGARGRPFLPEICRVAKWRLNHTADEARQTAAQLVAQVAPALARDRPQLTHMAAVLLEQLGEDSEPVLGAVLGALHALVAALPPPVGDGEDAPGMQPPAKELLPRLTPLLRGRERHPEVQANCVRLIGLVARHAPEQIPSREWLRVCVELLGLLKATRKATRKAAIAAFGSLARAVGPLDVLGILLDNLSTLDRQARVCSTVAIAVVADACEPFTVIPALMNEYRTPATQVRTGVLKAFSFLFEYVGPKSARYVHSVLPLLTDALCDRDVVHRQTAMAACKHLAVYCKGAGLDDCMVHLLNLVWPNVFEESPHVASAFHDAVEALAYCLGPGLILRYCLQGLFHPAKKVRAPYWKVYLMLLKRHGPLALAPHYPCLAPVYGARHAIPERDLLPSWGRPGEAGVLNCPDDPARAQESARSRQGRRRSDVKAKPVVQSQDGIVLPLLS